MINEIWAQVDLTVGPVDPGSLAVIISPALERITEIDVLSWLAESTHWLPDLRSECYYGEKCQMEATSPAPTLENNEGKGKGVAEISAITKDLKM